MEKPIVQVDVSDWKLGIADDVWIRSLEEGKVLYFANLAFRPTDDELALMKPELQAPHTRSITLDNRDRFKGGARQLR